MTDEPAVTPIPLFRPNKRKRTYRKRDHSHDSGGDEDEGQTPINNNKKSNNDARIERDSEEEQEARGVIRPSARPKRGGFKFSSFSGSGGLKRKEDGEEEGEGGPLVLAQGGEKGGEEEELGLGTGRFVKPAGKVAVEDRHLMAYIDSKLGKQQPANPVGNAATTNTTDAFQPPTSGRWQQETSESHRAAALGKVEEVDLPPRTSQIPHPRHQPKNLNTAQLLPTPRANDAHKKRRRQPPAPNPGALAREKAIEDIMRESHGTQAPAYTPTQSHRNGVSTTNTTTAQGGSGGYAPETDAAVAQAFEQQFIADMEERTRRGRPPAPPKEKGIGKETESHGPKLGGSRSWREGFKAWEAQQKKMGGK